MHTESVSSFTECSNNLTPNYVFELLYVLCTVDCFDGEVRLVEGESEWEGRLEVCFSRRWGTVSSDGWTQTNTQVVCNDLGYLPDTSISALYFTQFQLFLCQCYVKSIFKSSHNNYAGACCFGMIFIIKVVILRTSI